MKGVKGRPFKPGVSGNPKGRPKLTQEEREFKSLTGTLLLKLLDELFFMSDFEVKAVLSNPESPKIRRILAAVLNKAEILGDFQRLDGLLNRKMGKVSDHVEHNLPTPMIIKRLDGSSVELRVKIPGPEDEDKASGD